MKAAVVAHAGKTFGGGLPELRRVLRAEGFDDPIWHEVPKSKKAPPVVTRALKEGAELVFVWGGDGMVQRCIDVMAGSDARLAVLPAGTSNLFATNLGIPQDVRKAVAVGLRGRHRRIDVGRFEDERFATMAGVGFDAAMIEGSSRHKDRLGRASYVLSGIRSLATKPFEATIEVDGVGWYDGPATCILLGNVGNLFGGVEVFEDARPDDGMIELGVLTAEGPVDVARAVVRTVAGDAQKSPFVRVTKARSVTTKLDRKMRYEVDGGARTKVRSFRVAVEPGAVTVCVPHAT